jgi:phosphate transport system protein
MNLTRHFDLELADLKRSLVSMSNLVERSLTIAINAIISPTVEAREQCRILEEQLDSFENAIEDRCHQIIALQQPMAGELRLVIAAMRITSDLEQIGDLAESVAKRAAYIARNGGATNPPEIETLARLVLSMQHNAMDAFVTGDLSLGENVISDEHKSDLLTKRCYEGIQALMKSEPDRIREYTHLLRAAALLEHIGDVAVSIADETVYIQKGTINRHLHQQP